MSQALWTLAALGIGVVVLINRCEWLKWCDPIPGLDQIVSQFNKLPTLIQNPSTNQYRSVTMDTEDPKVVSKRIQDQSDFSNPKTATAVKQYVATTNKNAGDKSGGTSGPNGTGYNCNSELCKRYPTNCPGCKKSSFARSHVALSLHGYKMSVH